MHNRRTYLITVLTIILFACSCGNVSGPATVPESRVQTNTGLKVIIPNDFKYLAELDKTAAKHNLSKLRETELPDDDFEVRVSVASRFGNDLLVLSRTTGTWQAKHFPFALCNADRKIENVGQTLDVPKSGWEPTWNKLKEAGLLSLSGVQNSGITDGYGYIVESNVNKTYLLYEFVNPQGLKGNDGKQMVELGNIIANEFGLRMFRGDFSCIPQIL